MRKAASLHPDVPLVIFEVRCAFIRTMDPHRHVKSDATMK